MSNDLLDKKYDIIVIDSAAFISGAKVEYKGKEFYTIPEVLKEIKDKQSRGLLQNFPYEIKLKEPSEESIQTVANFARATGDLIHVSRVDLKVMALTYQLEVQLNGKEGLNTEPIDTSKYFEGGKQLRTVGVNVSEQLCQYYYSEGGCMFGNRCRNRHPGDVISSHLRAKLLKTEDKESNSTESPSEEPTETIHESEDSNPPPSAPPEPKKPFTGWKIPVMKQDIERDDKDEFPSLEEAMKENDKNEISKEMKEKIYQQFVIHKPDVVEPENHTEDEEEQKNQSENTVSNEESLPVTTEQSPSLETSTQKPSGSHILVSSTIASTAYVDEDDNEGWASIDNLNDGWGNQDQNDPALNKERKEEEEEEEDYHHVACCTGDYTMQNVLIQMGLRILSIDGLRIKTARLWTYRCRLCYAVCRDMTQLFCPSCGHNSLARVPLIIDKYGRTKIGEIRGRPKLRGTIYSVSKANRGMGGLLTSADQLETGIWKQRLYQSRAKNTNAQKGMKEILTETFGDSRSQQTNDIVVGFGRKNPNAMKGRERRGKKHRQH